MEAIRLTGLWKAKDKKGRTYLQGSISPVVKVFVMENGYKTEDKQPDYYLYLSPHSKQKDQENGF